MWYDLCISYVFNIFYDISTVIIITLNTIPIIIIVVVQTYSCTNADYLLAHPSSTLLDALVSYDIYAHTARFSKRFAGTTPPLSYVVIT
jgi:hypothetical protein